MCLQMGKGGLLPHAGGGLNNINGLNGLNGFGPGVLSPSGDIIVIIRKKINIAQL